MKFRSVTQTRWLVLLAACLINLCIGSLYSWSVFSGPMAAELSKEAGISLSSSDLAVVFSLANAVGPVTMIFGGLINDRIGPRRVIQCGGILFGAGFLVSGSAQSLSILILGYSFFSGLGMSLVYGCTVSCSVKFFPDRKGFAGGVTTASYGLSSALLPFAANALINGMGVRFSFHILGILFITVILAASRLFLRCPDDFVPDGWQPSPHASAKSIPKTDMDFRQMLTDPLYYLLLILLTCGASAGMMIISQASALGQELSGMSAAGAAAAVSSLALFNSLGRALSGALSDRLGRMRILTAALLLGSFGLLILFFSDGSRTASFLTGILSIGACFGSIMGIYPGITADCFGSRNNSVNYGFLFIGFALAGLLGPLMMQRLLDATGSYRPSFAAALVLVAAALLLTQICSRNMTRRDKSGFYSRSS